MSAMGRVYGPWVIRILVFVLVVFIGIVYINILRFLNGSGPVVIHPHPYVFSAFVGSIIFILITIILAYIDSIGKHKWKRAGLLTIGMVIAITCSFTILERYSKKANSDSFRYIQRVFSKQKIGVSIECERNAEREFESFSEHFDIGAIRDVKHWPILGRHIFVVKAKGIKPFVIDVSVSYKQTMTAWIHLEREWEDGSALDPGQTRWGAEER
jgi:hypothetical protein